jgi:glycosyltransferase involved in cell wall biosynthesis
MMKILVIVNAKFGYDGISIVATNYYLYQDKTDIEMDLLTINPINDVLAKSITTYGNKHFVLDNRNSNPISYILKLIKIISENKYDIVYVHGNSATMAVELIAAKIARCKVRVAHCHTTQCNHKFFNRLLLPLFNHLYTDCCTCSKEAGEYLFGNRDYYIVSNGINIDDYTFSNLVRERVRRENQIQDRFVIGHIGRFTYLKNQEFLLKTLKEILDMGENAVLLLVGEGELQNELEKQAKTMGISDRVIFYGTTDKVYEIVQAMDCFVFPSLFEGLGIVAIEAQASGLPCVASTKVPRKILINDDTTFLSLDKPVKVWAEEIIKRRTAIEKRVKGISSTKIKMKEDHFDIVSNCLEMRLFYEKILKKD